MKFVEWIIKRLIDYRNDCARSRTEEYFEEWSILKMEARKLTQEEIELYIGS